MLLRLDIQNYALISHQQIDFGHGFTVMTGETGAGKSIILGALALVMGARADAKAVAEGQAKCIVEAEFDISQYHLKAFFDNNDLDYDDGQHCILRREVAANGKSRAFVNDTPVPLTLLKQLSERLIDIHSQHENLLLRDEDFQLRFLDLMADNEVQRNDYKVAYGRWAETRNSLEKLRNTAEENAKNIDYITFQHRQLAEANITDGELSQLEDEYTLLTHAEDIKIVAQTISAIFDDDEAGIMPHLKTAETEMRKLKQYVPNVEELTQRVHSAMLELEDIAAEVARVNDNTEANPERLEFVTQRIDTINTLLRKHRLDTEAQLLALQASLAEQIAQYENLDDDIARLTAQLDEAHRRLEEAAKILSDSRKAVVPHVEKRLVEALAQLAVPHPQIIVKVEPAQDFTPSGADKVTLLFAANLNQQPRPVAQVASGGEISRLMLCVKDMMAQRKALPTIIFDEIDTGISGTTAMRMGDIMAGMAKHIQIIAITHLPQVAARADSHLVVYKQDTGNATRTFIKPIDGQERVEQIAVMLSGTPPTDAAKITASELLAGD